MATKRQEGTVITWEDSPGAGDYAITLDSLATVSARQGAKGDLQATFGDLWRVDLLIDTGGTAVAGETYDLYWSASNSATAGTGNAGGASGTDAAYTGYSSNLADSLKDLIFVGSLIGTAIINQNHQQSFYFSPPSRYGMPILYNATANTMGTGNSIKLTELKIVSD